jgi:hypothetical protein
MSNYRKITYLDVIEYAEIAARGLAKWTSLCEQGKINSFEAIESRTDYTFFAWRIFDVQG